MTDTEITTKRIAVLSNEGRLIASVDVPIDQETDMIDPGDLPLNGTYKWDKAERTFHKVGTGFGKVLRPNPPYSTEFILSILIDGIGAAAPGPAVEWNEWFKSDLRRREEEQLSIRGK